MAIEESKLSLLDERNPINVWNDISYAILLCKADKKLYERYKRCEAKANKNNVTNVMTSELSDDQLEEMRVLSILDNLGYSLDEIGTYLYKEVIVTAYNEIKYRPNLAGDLKNEYSDFYHQIARDYYEMGVSSLHEYIKRASCDSNGSSNINIKSISGNNKKDYKNVAFDIVAYMMENELQEKKSLRKI